MDHPIEKCLETVNRQREQLWRMGKPLTVYQTWLCQHCDSRQTMSTPNAFHRAGVCEECGQTTIIRSCNYVGRIGRGGAWPG